MNKTSISTLLFLSILTCGFAQETELDRRNGFKDIKLASSIDSIKGAEFKKDFHEKGHYPAKLYFIDHPDYQSIGEVKIDRVEVRTYKSLIYQILVITEKDTRLMKGMEAALGKPNYNIRDETYHWEGKKGVLRFSSHSRNQLALLYTSTIVHKIMKEDKANKIKDISKDF